MHFDPLELSLEFVDDGSSPAWDPRSITPVNPAPRLAC
jgi:hypothetical protein